jgi:glutathionylspermidine synthase
MIYQGLIRKKAEYRVLVLGESVFTAEILSEDLPDDVIDWRSQNHKTLPMRLTRLPPEIDKMLVSFLRRANLLMGVFDLALSTNGDWIFFEINEQGQTLWVEEALPEMPILDAQTEFLINPSASFHYVEGSQTVRYSDFITDKVQIAQLDVAIEKSQHLSMVKIPIEEIAE